MTGGVSELRVNRLSRLVALALTAFSCCWLLLQLLRDMSWGGNAWKQGDWLINSLVEPVRRGPMGRAILDLSDYSGLSPLYSVGLVQAILTVLIFLALLRLCLRSSNPALFLVTISSSAMLVIFWAADPQGSMRKEMFSIAALAWIAIGVFERRTVLILLSTLIFCIGPWGHEINLIFAPAYMALLGMWVLSGGSRPLAIAMLALVCVNGFAALSYSLLYLVPQNAANMCQPLLERGVSIDMCGGAINWLGYDQTTGSNRIVETFFHGNAFLKQFFLFILALAPWIYVLSLSSNKKWLLICAVVILLPIVPLFFIAVDWGRWTSLYFFSLFILYTSAFNLGFVQLERPVRPRFIIGFLLLGLLITPDHINGIYWGGLVRYAVGDVLGFLF